MNGVVATDGEIAALNLESARRRAWARFMRDARSAGVAEMLAELERLKLQFFGDMHALDRMEMLAVRLAQVDDTFRAELIRAEAASAAHRFVEARDHLARAASIGAPRKDIERQLLAIDQACGTALDAVLVARQRFAEARGQLEDVAPLAALLADIERFDEADILYRQTLDSYEGTSPFPRAWICFQLGMLWGELVPQPNREAAAHWYSRAIAYLPMYVKARVHLAEICAADAESLLVPVLWSSDPEVSWRLADALQAQGRLEEAEIQLDVARHGFESALAKHLLAFADHAAEFYAGRGNDRLRALELARANVANRPTRRALEQMHAILVKCP